MTLAYAPDSVQAHRDMMKRLKKKLKSRNPFEILKNYKKMEKLIKRYVKKPNIIRTETYDDWKISDSNVMEW